MFDLIILKIFVTVQSVSILRRRLNVQLKDKVSVKPGFSFSQLSLYYLTSITKCVTNVRLQAILSEVSLSP